MICPAPARSSVRPAAALLLGLILAAPAVHGAPAPGAAGSLVAGAASRPPSVRAALQQIPAEPLPPQVELPVLVDRGVRWTERLEGAVAFVWTAEVRNPNAFEVVARVAVRLHDAAADVIHEAVREVVLGPAESVSFTADGSMGEALATRADHWRFVVVSAEPSGEPPGGPAGEGASAAGDAAGDPDAGAGAGDPAGGGGAAGGDPAAVDPVTDPQAGDPGAVDDPAAGGEAPETAPVAADAAAPLPAELEVVPLTDDVEEPVLDPGTAQILIEDASLQELDLAGKMITVRCLVRADGTVADARVYRISPELSLRAADEALRDAVRRSAILFWRFEPARKAGAAVAVWHMLTVRYEPGAGGG